MKTTAIRAIREHTSTIARYTARKVTLLARLHRAQERQDDVACDRIYSELNIIDEIITGLTMEIARICRREGEPA